MSNREQIRINEINATITAYQAIVPVDLQQTKDIGDQVRKLTDEKTKLSGALANAK